MATTLNPMFEGWPDRSSEGKNAKGVTRVTPFVPWSLRAPAQDRIKTGSLHDAIACAEFVIAAQGRTARVDPAQHGISIQRRAPTVLKARHDLTAPGVDRRQVQRHRILSHQYYFERAAAGPARIACNRRAFVSWVRAQTVSRRQFGFYRTRQESMGFPAFLCLARRARPASGPLGKALARPRVRSALRAPALLRTSPPFLPTSGILTPTGIGRRRRYAVSRSQLDFKADEFIPNRIRAVAIGNGEQFAQAAARIPVLLAGCLILIRLRFGARRLDGF